MVLAVPAAGRFLTDAHGESKAELALHQRATETSFNENASQRRVHRMLPFNA